MTDVTVMGIGGSNVEIAAGVPDLFPNGRGGLTFFPQSGKISGSRAGWIQPMLFLADIIWFLSSKHGGVVHSNTDLAGTPL